MVLRSFRHLSSSTDRRRRRQGCEAGWGAGQHAACAGCGRRGQRYARRGISRCCTLTPTLSRRGRGGTQRRATVGAARMLHRRECSLFPCRSGWCSEDPGVRWSFARSLGNRDEARAAAMVECPLPPRRRGKDRTRRQSRSAPSPLAGDGRGEGTERHGASPFALRAPPSPYLLPSRERDEARGRGKHCARRQPRSSPSPLAGESRGEGGWHDRPPSLPGRAVYPRAYFIVGMTNSAPLRMPVGQRVVTVLRWV